MCGPACQDSLHGAWAWLRCGAFAAGDPVRNLEEGTVLGQEAHGYFFLLEAEDSLLATEKIPLPARQIKKMYVKTMVLC